MSFIDVAAIEFVALLKDGEEDDDVVVGRPERDEQPYPVVFRCKSEAKQI